MLAALSSGSVQRLLILALLAAACSGRPSPGRAEAENAAQAGDPTARTLRGGVEEWFTDTARESGLDFVHFNGMTGEFHFPEVIPPGVALLDYDGDDDLDVFVPQGQMLGKKPSSEALYPPQVPLKSRLYRNDPEVRGEARDRLAEAMKLYPNELAFAHAAARLFAAAPDDRIRDGRRARAIVQALLSRQPRTIELAETMAMASAEVGQYSDAMLWQREAIQAAERMGRRNAVERLTDNLKRYRAGRPCRTPWRADEPIEFYSGAVMPAGSPR